MTWSFSALRSMFRPTAPAPKTDLDVDGFAATFDPPPTRDDLVAAGLLYDETTPDRSGVVEEEPPLAGSLADRQRRRL